MTSDQNMVNQIESNETWLRSAMPADPPVPLERTKLRVRIEANHAWLRRNAPADPRAAGLLNVKRAVRLKTGRSATATPTRARRGRHWARLAAGLTAAAAVLALGLMLNRVPRVGRDDASLAVVLDDWIDAVALDALDSDDPASLLASLEDGLVSVETGLAEEGFLDWGWQGLDELGENLEVLLDEMG